MSKQIDRINQMEAYLDTLTAANKQLISALKTFRNAQEAYIALEEYTMANFGARISTTTKTAKSPPKSNVAFSRKTVCTTHLQTIRRRVLTHWRR